MIIDEFELVKTCGACPEQYDVYLDDKRVAYLRLRHGYFYAQVPYVGGKTVYESSDMKGDGIFEFEERNYFLEQAVNEIRKEID